MASCCCTRDFFKGLTRPSPGGVSNHGCFALEVGRPEPLPLPAPPVAAGHQLPQRLRLVLGLTLSVQIQLVQSCREQVM